MFQVSPQVTIRVAHEPANFRFGIDGLSGLIRRDHRFDPMNGYLYLFRNKSRTMIRFLFYDGQGFYLCTKRLSNGKFPWWPSRDQMTISSREFQVLLWAGNPNIAGFAEDWKKIS